MTVTKIEEKIKRNVNSLEKIFDKHESYLTRLGSAIAKYIEISDLVKSLEEAAGAEIESKGRATKRTIFGKSGLLGKGKKGKGLAQYLAEKAHVLGMLENICGHERKESSQQARYLKTMTKTTKAEIKEERGEEKKLSKKAKKKLKKIEKLSEKSEKILKKEAKRDKKLSKVAKKELKDLKKVSKYASKESAYARKLRSFVMASRYLKKMESFFEKEEKYFTNFIKREVKIADGIAKDLKKVHKLIKEHEKIETIAGGSEKGFKKEEKKEEKEEKKEKRVEKMMKRLEKVQKHLKKVKKGAAKMGVEIEENVKMLDAEERKLIEEEEKMEKEIEDAENLFEKIQKLSKAISKISTNITTSEVKLKPQIRWINQALVSAYKTSKKNQGEGLKYLEKITSFAEKSLIKPLNSNDKQRREMAKEIGGEESVIKKIDKDLSALKRLEDKKFIENLEKLDEKLKKIEKLEDKGTKKAIKDMKGDIKELKKDLKGEKKVAKSEKKAGAKKTTKEEKETKAEISNLKKEMKELKGKHSDMKGEFNPAIKKIQEAIEEAPRFEFEGSGGLLAFFGKNPEDEVLGNLEIVEEYLEKEEEEDSKEVKQLKKWIENKTDLNQYIKFVETLGKSFNDERKLLSNLINYYGDIAKLEKDFIESMEKGEKSFQDLEEGIKELEQVMNKYNDLFGEEEKKILSEMKKLFSDSKKALSEMKKAENAISSLAHNLPHMERREEEAKKHIKDMTDILNTSKKNAEKASKFFNKGQVQAKL